MNLQGCKRDIGVGVVIRELCKYSIYAWILKGERKIRKVNIEAAGASWLVMHTECSRRTSLERPHYRRDARQEALWWAVGLIEPLIRKWDVGVQGRKTRHIPWKHKIFQHRSLSSRLVLRLPEQGSHCVVLIIQSYFKLKPGKPKYRWGLCSLGPTSSWGAIDSW